MNRTMVQIMAGTGGAIAVFLCCFLILGQVCAMCLVKKAAYATLIGMPLGSFAGIYLVDRFLYKSKVFTVVGTLMGLALTIILLLGGIYLVAAVPAAFFSLPVLISLSCLLGLKTGFNLQLKRRDALQRGSN
jgi:hypothetical protein